MKRPTVNKSDEYFGKIVKYIPTEIVAGYVALSGFIKALPMQLQFGWCCFVTLVLLILTPAYLRRSTQDASTSRAHAVCGTIAFAAWVFATGGLFERFQITGNGGWYHRAMGSIVLVLVCLSLPLIENLVPAGIKQDGIK